MRMGLPSDPRSEPGCRGGAIHRVGCGLEEIAEAMADIFGDVNGNGAHEVGISPAGDVPLFFTCRFHASIYEHIRREQRHPSQ